ncbi:MAG: ThiF family adenylyltransferase [Acidobacteriales bacterium]|nr:ThiF family adenylyltransferase [Terriglobales bacterium]
MTPEERDRYSRQILFSGIGEQGQELLLASRVAVVGCGALGSFHAAALARAGVGKLILIDRDYVEASNLQRQWLYDESDAAESMPKAIAAERALKRINSEVEVAARAADLTPANIGELLGGVSLIMDGTDNFETRYLINDFAVREGIPWVYGAAVGSYGLTMPVIPGVTACLKCVYPEPPTGSQPTCETAGVLNAITAAVASLQVGAAIKILTGHGVEVARRITMLDVWSGVVRQVEQPAPEPACPACGERRFVHLEGARRVPISLCGRNAVQIHERERPIDLEDLRKQLEPLGMVRANEFALRFFLPPYELTIFPDGRAIIKGTTDVGLARSLYARYIGS